MKTKTSDCIERSRRNEEKWFYHFETPTRTSILRLSFAKYRQKKTITRKSKLPTNSNWFVTKYVDIPQPKWLVSSMIEMRANFLMLILINCLRCGDLLLTIFSLRFLLKRDLTFLFGISDDINRPHIQFIFNHLTLVKYFFTIFLASVDQAPIARTTNYLISTIR